MLFCRSHIGHHHSPPSPHQLFLHLIKINCQVGRGFQDTARQGGGSSTLPGREGVPAHCQAGRGFHYISTSLSSPELAPSTPQPTHHQSLCKCYSITIWKMYHLLLYCIIMSSFYSPQYKLPIGKGIWVLIGAIAGEPCLEEPA